MGNVKRLTSFFVALILVLGCVSTGFTVDVDALEIQYARSQTQDRTANFSTDFTLTGNYADDVIAVAQAQLGKTTLDMKYTEAWCANFSNDCARLTGMPDDIIPYNYSMRASCIFMYQYMLTNCNAHVIEDERDVRAGDYVFYICTATNFYLHVGIVESPEYYLEGNTSGMVRHMPFNYNYFCYQHPGYSNSFESGHVKRVYVRPNYPEPPKNGYTYTDPEKYKDHVPERVLAYKEPVATSGYDVCWTQAVLYTLGYLGAVTGEFDENTVAAVEAFQKDKKLDVTGEVDEVTLTAIKKAYDKKLSPVCTNFKSDKKIYAYNDTIKLSANIQNANWYRLVVRDTNKKELKRFDNLSACSFNASELGEGAYTAYFKVVNDHTHIYSKVVSFTVEKPKVSVPELNVAAGSAFEETKLFWEQTAYTTAYDLNIINLDTNANYLTKNNITNNECSLFLPKGNYSAYVVSKNDYSKEQSNPVEFAVKTSESANLGDNFCAQISLNGYYLSCTDTNQVEWKKADGSYAQMWYFEKNTNSNGYKIKSCDNIKLLTLSSDGTIKVADSQNSMAQRWLIAKGENGMSLIPSNKTDRVLYYSSDIARVRNSLDSSSESFNFKLFSNFHKYELTEITSPTCTEDGHAIYHCILCGENMEKIFPAKGHSYHEEKLSDDHSVFTCVHCGDSYETGTIEPIKTETPDTPETPDQSDDSGKEISVPRTLATHTFIMGDIDRDGRLTSNDSLLITRASVGLEHLTELGEFIADVDCDGKVTSADSLYVLRSVVNFYTNTKVKDVIVIQSEFDILSLLKDEEEQKKK